MNEENLVLRKIESTIDVKSIKYHNIPLWWVLRIYLYDSMYGKSIGFVQHQDLSISKIIKIARSFLYYNPFKLFLKRDMWVFNSADSRRMIGNHAYHRVSGSIIEQFPNSLVIESVFPSFHKRKKYTRGEHVIGISVFYFVMLFIDVYLRLVRPKIVNESLIIDILKKTKTSLNYLSIVRVFLSQYFALNCILKLNRPRLATIECPYTQLGFVLALKKNGVKVVELQHGVINSSHYAYNSTLKNDVYNVDAILVYGDIVKNCFMFDNDKYVRASEIYVVGSSILERYLSLKLVDPFEKYRGTFISIILISGQEDNEKALFDFINEVAASLSKVLFIYVPRRNKDYKAWINSENICIQNGNIYTFIKYCDLHSTLNSTTCLEANFFNKCNLFMNINGISDDYYGDVLNENFGAFYADTPGDYIRIYNSLSTNKSATRNEDCYASNHNILVNKALNAILNKYF